MSSPPNNRLVVVVLGYLDDLRSVIALALRDAGYTVHEGRAELAALPAIVRLEPVLVVLQTDSGQAAIRLVEVMRTDPAMRAWPVIVATRDAGLANEIQASGNVRAVLPSPFSLAHLVEAVAEVIHTARFERRIEAQPVTPAAVLLRAADVLASGERALMLQWVQRVRVEEPFASHPELENREFLDSFPALLNRIILSLRRPAPVIQVTTDPAVHAQLLEHARLRQDQGIPVEGIICEFQVLRDVVVEFLHRDFAPSDVLDVMSVLNPILDETMRQSIDRHFDELEPPR